MYGSHGSSLCKHLLHLRFLYAASEQSSRECADLVASFAKERDGLVDQVVSLRARTKTDLVDQTHKEIEAVRSTFQDLNLKNESFADHIEQLRKEVKQHYLERAKRQQETEKLKHKIDRNRVHHLTEQFQHDEMQQELELLRQELVTQQNENKKRKNLIKDESHRASRLDSMVEEGKMQTDKLQKHFEHREAALPKIEAVLADIRKNYAEQLEKNKGLKTKIQDRRKDSNLLANKICSFRKATSQTRNTAHSSNLRLSDEKDKIFCLGSKIRSFRGEIRIVKEEFESVKEQTKRSEIEVKELKDSADSTCKKINNPHKDLSIYKSQTEIQWKHEEVNSLKSKVSNQAITTRTHWSEDLTKRQHLATEIANLKFTIESLSRKLRNAEAKYAESLALKGQTKQALEQVEVVVEEKKASLKEDQLMLEDQKKVTRNLDKEIHHSHGVLRSNRRRHFVLYQQNEKLRSTKEHLENAVLGGRVMAAANPLFKTDTQMHSHLTQSYNGVKLDPEERNEDLSKPESLTKLSDLLENYAHLEKKLRIEIKSKRQQNHSLTLTVKSALRRQSHLSERTKQDTKLLVDSSETETSVWNAYVTYKKELCKTNEFPPFR